MTSMVSQMGMHDSEVDEESLSVPTHDGASLELRVYRLTPFSPAAAEHEGESASPLILLFHGGHHVLGSPGVLSTLCGSLTKAFNAVVVSAGYRLAPEHPFPVGVEDAWDVLSWCAKNASSTLYADPTQGFIVGGVSSGGSLSVILAHQAHEQKLEPPITGIYLAAASVRMPGNDPAKLPDKYKERYLSRQQDECIDSPVLPTHMVELMETLYQPDKDSKLYAPLGWPNGHADMPRTYSQVCGMDPCRDENLIYADMLKEEGVPAKVELYAGLPHAFWGTLPALPQSEKWRQDTINGFKWLLQKS